MNKSRFLLGKDEPLTECDIRLFVTVSYFSCKWKEFLKIWKNFFRSFVSMLFINFILNAINARFHRIQTFTIGCVMFIKHQVYLQFFLSLIHNFHNHILNQNMTKALLTQCKWNTSKIITLNHTPVSILRSLCRTDLIWSRSMRHMIATLANTINSINFRIIRLILKSFI